MKVRVFYKQNPSEDAPSVKESMGTFGDVDSRLEALEKKLKEAKNEIEQRKIQEQIVVTKRSKVRMEGLNNLQEGKPERKEGKEIRSILAGKTTENYLGSDLHMLHKRGVDIANLTLVKESNPSEAADSKKMETGNTFIVNFGGNESLARKIGAGDILPPEVTEVKINGVKCERRETPRPWYYNDSMKPSYQKIYDGYKIEITSKKDSLTQDEIKTAENAAEKRWRKIRAQDMIAFKEWNPLTELSDDKGLFSDVVKLKQEQAEIQRKYLSYWWERLNPGSDECIAVFTDACNYAGIDESWARNPDLYKLLEKESWGYVGRLNYTLQGIDTDGFKKMALSRERIPAKSSASGLWQLLLENVDKYYPSGRNGIGNSIEEAIWMVKYIEDRYGDPTTALSMHWKTGTYIHSGSWFTLSKSFQEWY